MCLLHWDPDSEQSGHSEEGGHSVAANSRKCVLGQEEPAVVRVDSLGDCSSSRELQAE